MESSPWTGARHAPQAVPPEPRRPLRIGPPGDPEVGRKPARLEVLERAEALTIPWERILLEEIHAEQTLRRYASDVEAMPLETRLAILPVSFLSSWRARDEIQALSC